MTEDELLNSDYAKEQAEISKKKALKTAAKLKPSDEVWAVVNGLEFLTAETIAILTQRGQEWHDENPLGEKMYCRNDGYQFVIHSHEVQQLYKCGIRKAQEMLAIVRAAVGKDDNSYVSIKEFCKIIKEDEEDFRRALKYLDPDFSTD